MDAYYATEEPLPLDINRICKMIRVSNRTEKRHVLAIIVQFFEQSPDGFRHHRIDSEIAVYREKALKNKANAQRVAKPKESESHSETATKPVTTNHKPVTNIHIIGATDVAESKPLKRKSRIATDWEIEEDDPNHLYSKGKGMTWAEMEVEEEKFKNHHTAKGNVMLDWNAAWRTWVNNWLTYRKGAYGNAKN